MATNDEGTNGSWRKFLVPGAATLVGAGAGLVLTRTDKLRDNLPSLDDVGFGDLFGDLKSKISSTTGADSSGGADSGSGAKASASRRTLSPEELDEHRRRRADARTQRARR